MQGKRTLTDKQREEIRRNYKGKRGELDKLAEKYEVSRSTISRIIRPEQNDQDIERRRLYEARRREMGIGKGHYGFKLIVDPVKEPEIYEKLFELENCGIVGARQDYVRELIRKDIRERKANKE